MHMQHTESGRTCTDNAGLCPPLFKSLGIDSWTFSSRSSFCLLTSRAKVNSFSGASSQEALWADSYQRTLIGFATSWAGCGSPHADTCTSHAVVEVTSGCFGIRAKRWLKLSHVFFSVLLYQISPDWKASTGGKSPSFVWTQALETVSSSIPLCGHVSGASAFWLLLKIMTSEPMCFYNTIIKALRS